MFCSNSAGVGSGRKRPLAVQHRARTSSAACAAKSYPNLPSDRLALASRDGEKGECRLRPALKSPAGTRSPMIGLVINLLCLASAVATVRPGNSLVLAQDRIVAGALPHRIRERPEFRIFHPVAHTRTTPSGGSDTSDVLQQKTPRRVLTLLR